MRLEKKASVPGALGPVRYQVGRSSRFIGLTCYPREVGMTPLNPHSRVSSSLTAARCPFGMLMRYEPRATCKHCNHTTTSPTRRCSDLESLITLRLGHRAKKKLHSVVRDRTHNDLSDCRMRYPLRYATSLTEMLQHK